MFVNVPSDRPNSFKARAAWGEAMPAWIGTLAAACDASNQAEVGEKLERSSGYVSRIINNRYTGSYEEAEQLVRSRLGGEEVECPVWGSPIPLAACIRNRRAKGSPRNQFQHAYARSCPRCPHNTDIEESRA